MSEHTSGEWKIEYVETGVRWPAIYVDDAAWDGGRRHIAELSNHVAELTRTDRWRKTTDAQEAEANARLIAAAPDLLAALTELADTLTNTNSAAKGWPEVQRARAAITKATAP